MIKRNDQIDGLRGITSIIILLFHLFCRYLQIYENNNLVWMEHWGTFGVIIFVLISGYLLGVESIKEENNKFNLLKYLKKKIFRLWPCYIISITLIMVVVKIVGLPGREVSWLSYILNIFFINGFCGIPYVDGAHWYLTTLISITIIIGVIKKFKFNNNFIVYCFWILIVMFMTKIGYGNITIFFGGTYLGVALIGFSLARILTKFSANEMLKWLILLFLSFLFCFFIQGTTTSIILIISLFIVIPCLIQKIKFFENKLFLKLGSISYPLYLIHQNIGYVIIRKLIEFFGNYQIFFSIIATFCVLLLSFVICSIEKMIKNKTFVKGD